MATRHSGLPTACYFCRLGRAMGRGSLEHCGIEHAPPVAIKDLTSFLKQVEVTGCWPQGLREMLYLQLPKQGAKDAGERRPIAFLPQTGHQGMEGKVCRPQGKVGRGALDETFDLAFEIEQTTAAGVPQAGVLIVLYQAADMWLTCCVPSCSKPCKVLWGTGCRP
eukprot:1858619-Amphidinium_carterae.2